MQYNRTEPHRWAPEGRTYMLFRTTVALRSVCDISPALLQKLGVRGLLLDVDNTLTTHDNPTPAPGVEAWIA